MTTSERQPDAPGASSAVTGINPRITAGIRYPVDGGIPGEWHLRIIRSDVPAGRVTASRSWQFRSVARASPISKPARSR